MSGSSYFNGQIKLFDNKVYQKTISVDNVKSNNLNTNSRYQVNNIENISGGATTSGLACVYNPTSVQNAVIASGFTSISTVNTNNSNIFASGDIISITNANNKTNNGMYEVLSYSLGIITINTTPTEAFCKNKFTVDVVVSGIVTRVNVGIIRIGTDGVWETSSGSNIPLTYTDISNALFAGDGIDLISDTISVDLKANGGLVIESTELAVDLSATNITGTLAVGDGGTGTTSHTLGEVLIGAGTGAITTATILSLVNALAVSTKTASYVVDTDNGVNTDYLILVDTVAAAVSVTITLPAPTTSRYIKIKDSTGAAVTYNITVSGGGSNIDGSPTYILNGNYNSVSVISDGTDWFIA
jgi:hypothetical protein